MVEKITKTDKLLKTINFYLNVEGNQDGSNITMSVVTMVYCAHSGYTTINLCDVSSQFLSDPTNWMVNRD